MTDLHRLVVEAQSLAGAHPCNAFGHQWASIGGRHCDGCEEGREDERAQPVYQCERCEEYDYGYPGGPGFDDCVKYCGLSPQSPVETP